jgi:hypothetical protein
MDEFTHGELGALPPELGTARGADSILNGKSVRDEEDDAERRSWVGNDRTRSEGVYEWQFRGRGNQEFVSEGKI